MRPYGPDRIHNVGIFGHGGSGKTTLVESLLLTAHAIGRAGRVEDGTTVSDYDPDEQKRRMSINLAVAPLEWHDDKINLIDTPGYADFVGDVASAMRVLDGAIIVLDAAGGVEVGTEQVWEQAVQAGVPRLLFINKLDRENPIGQAKDFRGIISLRQQRAWMVSPSHDGGFIEENVPADMDAEMHRWRTELIDKIAATNDDLIERYLEGGEDALTREELLTGLRAGISNGSIVPVFCGSALQLGGMAQLLNGIVDSIPSAARKTTQATELNTGKTVTLKPVASEPVASCTPTRTCSTAAPARASISARCTPCAARSSSPWSPLAPATSAS
jgi:elongation factor G